MLFSKTGPKAVSAVINLEFSHIYFITIIYSRSLLSNINTYITTARYAILQKYLLKIFGWSRWLFLSKFIADFHKPSTGNTAIMWHFMYFNNDQEYFSYSRMIHGFISRSFRVWIKEFFNHIEEGKNSKPTSVQYLHSVLHVLIRVKSQYNLKIARK